MRKQKGSLTFPSNPLARLQELRAEVESLPSEAPNDASNDASNETSNDASNEVSFDNVVREDGKPGQERTKILLPSPKEPTSRLNVELRDSLHTRLKTYSATHKVPIRMIIDTLVEEFLTEAEQERP